MKDLDHIVYAAPDLEAGCAEFESVTGVAPAYGGAHEGRGTHNALASLGPTTYIEILAPQNDTKIDDPWITYCRGLAKPKMLTFCMRPVRNLDSVAAASRDAGFDGMGPFAMSRARPDGVLLQWQLFSPFPDRFGYGNPFYIDWGDSEHPAASTPRAGQITSLTVHHAEHEALALHYKALGVLGISVSGFDASDVGASGDAISISATIETASGTVTLS